MGTTTKRISSSSSDNRYRLTPSQRLLRNERREGRILDEGDLRLLQERVNIAEQELVDLETRLSNLERMVRSLVTHWAAAGRPIPPIPPSLRARMQNQR